MPLKIATLDDAWTTISEPLIREFAGGLRGDIVAAGEPEYEAVRKIWNGLIDRRPALIVRCADEADVIATVKFVRAHNLRVSVRAGGHNVAGKSLCEGGLVIDLGRMNGVKINHALPSVHVQAGARLGDVDEVTRPYGFAVPVGVVSRTGIAGLTLHGGMGWLLRREGLTIDNILRIEVITAEGEKVVASSDENADLFWALRGGGGNFGVVTAFEYRLRPVPPQVWFAAVLYPFAEAQKAIGFWREFMAGAPPELSSFCVLRSRSLSSVEGKGERLPVVAFLACYTGPFERGEEILRPLREWSTPIADFSGPMDFHLGVQRMFDKDYPAGRCYYWDSMFFNDLESETIDRIVEHAGRSVSPLSSVNIWALGGAMNRVDACDTPFDKRDCRFMVAVEANWEDREDADANIGWVADFVDALRPMSRAGVYLNFPGAAGRQEQLVKGCYDKNFARLRKIKRFCDPDNVWRGSFNIKP
ncbi:FAD-dependent oxidoreductase, BBE domain-containing [Syntrophotalea carbinolica DSM 2380]|uniref:FAD-dependent oxidoreductase, BBE domain-containing n=1 Tax=Syntrophotalea carbinolica (strain DSM 2380 / NBRC 103641 / GraBd1) TaxID=338963 RepID=Q3A4U9_SYNC1|nr:FAD-binding oxidoreductase [Syntrophotalea carbinolica]ABA88608.1 FAD-dependent oxidoreductase, BBE domain-containing [Syntrophotalea carbinolica DSM 2380]